MVFYLGLRLFDRTNSGRGVTRITSTKCSAAAKSASCTCRSTRRYKKTL